MNGRVTPAHRRVRPRWSGSRIDSSDRVAAIREEHQHRRPTGCRNSPSPTGCPTTSFEPAGTACQPRRRPNAALRRIVIVRLRSRHTPTIDYLELRVTAGNSKRDAIRCLKRYLARLYNDIQTIIATTQPRSNIAA